MVKYTKKIFWLMICLVSQTGHSESKTIM